MMLNQLRHILLLVVLVKICFYGEHNVNANDDITSDDDANEDEFFKLLTGTVKIGTKIEGELSYREVKENDETVMINIFYGQRLLVSNIFTDKHGQFEKFIPVDDVKLIENCKKIYIGFYSGKSELMQMLYSFAKNRLDAKESSVTKMYAKLESKQCLKFSEQKFHAHSIKIREHQNEMRRTDPRNMNKKGVKNNENQAFMNIFKVSFDQKIVNINEATENAEIVSNKNFLNEEKYRISNEYYENESKSYEGEVSSSAESLENKIKQLSNKVSNKFRSVFSGENKGKQKKPPHVFDLI